jgi:hypothetical protein
MKNTSKKVKFEAAKVASTFVDVTSTTSQTELPVLVCCTQKNLATLALSRFCLRKTNLDFRFSADSLEKSRNCFSVAKGKVSIMQIVRNQKLICRLIFNIT